MISVSCCLRNCRRRTLRWKIAGAVLLLVVATTRVHAQAGEVSLHVDFDPGTARSHRSSTPPASVAWLTPIEGEAPPVQPWSPHTYRMVQKNKQFDPHLMVVQVGSLVQFPNLDPFFHNVFSLHNGKRFDLGLYETGSQRGVRFDREGVSYIFCNIHPEMGAVILAVATPYFAVSHDGAIAIPHVPAGRYTLNVWSEGATAESMTAARRQVTVTDSGADLGSLRLSAATSAIAHHTNKFGNPYPPESPDSTGKPY